MPVLSQTPNNTYVGNGSVTVFAYTFRIPDAASLRVTFDDVVQASGFSISDVDSNDGGNVTFTVPPANDVEVRFERAISISRETDYIEGGALPAQVLDNDFDRIVMMVQDLDATVLHTSGTGAFDAEGRRLINLADAIDAQDAVTKSYVDGTIPALVASAENSATNAENSAVAAAASAASASSSFDSFDDRYLGAKAVVPTLDNDGLALVQGALYWNTALNEMFVFDSPSWISWVPVQRTAASVIVPTVTTAERDAVPTAGYFHYNNTLNQFEGYNGSEWGAVGGGATGGAGNYAFYENDQTVTVDYTLRAGKNAMTAGPITIASGVTVTIPSGATWSIV